MPKPLRNLIIALAAVCVVFLAAKAVIGRVVVRNTGIDDIQKMVAQGEYPGAVRALKAGYRFNTRPGLDAMQKFSMAVMRQALNEHDPFEQCYVATALAAYGDWSGREAIDRALNSSNYLVQKAAVEGLAKARNAQAIAILERFYRSSGMDGRLMALQGLGEVRQPAVMPILLEAAHSDDSSMEVWAVSGLGQLGNRQVAPYLQTLLSKTKNPLVRTETAHALLLLGDRSDETIAVIEKGLSTNDPQEASEAALSLVDARNSAVVGPLREAEINNNGNPRVRLAAAVALTHYGYADGVPLLKNALKDRRFGTYLPPLMGHVDFTVGRAFLVAAMNSDDTVTRLSAIEAIGRLGGEPEIAVLQDARPKVADPIILAQIAWALGKIGRPHCVPPLLDLVQSGEPEVRNTAADALTRTAIVTRAALPN